MSYPNEIIDEVRMQNDIVDVVSQYVPLGQFFYGTMPFS